jgi:hypothetical protein
VRSTKGKIQQYYFDLFRKDYPLPDGTIRHGDKPDVILHGERKIGIEITNFYLEDGCSHNSEQLQSKTREQVVAEAEAICQQAGCVAHHLTFGFDATVPIRDDGKRVLAQKIADLVTRIDGQQTGQVPQDVFRHLPELSFAWFVEKGWGEPWRVSQVCSTPFMSLDKLRGIIAEKEAKSRDYERCDAYWLLVVVDFINRAQDQQISAEGFDTIHSDVFAKTIVYKTAFGQVLVSGPSESF